jgi:aminopeptidase N
MKSDVKILLGILSVLAFGGVLCGCGFGVILIAVRLFAGSEAAPPAAPMPSAAPQATFTVTRSAATAAPGETGPLDPALVGADGIGDPYYPKMGNGGYDVRHYDLSIRVDLDVEEIDAVAVIAARSLQALGRFNLDLLEFDITSVQVDGAEAEFAQADGELIITPAAVIPKDSDFTVAVAYHGRPGGGNEYGGIDYLEGWNFHPGGVIVAGEPTGAETWFPSNNHPADKAAFDFHITVAKPYTAAANGVLKETADNGDGTRTFHWVMDNPMATYLSTVAIGNFELLEGASAAGRPFRNFVDADVLADLDPGVNALPAAMDFFSETFGPYPFATCGVVVHQIPLQFSLENQTLINMGYNFANETVTVHELAHQWYGDSVSVAAWKDIWLNEGFASYAEDLWWEHTKGTSALKDDLAARYHRIANLPLSQVNLLGDPGPDHLFDVEVYFRGALTLHALRLKVGDPTFFRILQTYFQQFKDKNASTEEFIGLAEEISNQPLEDFFRTWLYEKELPDIPELGLSS